jgi:hypothetical protein
LFPSLRSFQDADNGHVQIHDDRHMGIFLRRQVAPLEEDVFLLRSIWAVW